MAAVLRPPGPKKHLLLGDLPAMKEDPLGFERDTARDYGDVALIRFAQQIGYQICHPDLVHQVLVQDAHLYRKAPLYRMLLTRFLGDGLVTSEGDFWRRQRKLAAPAFHSERLHQYADVMVKFTAQMVAGWEDGSRLDMNREMTRLAMSISTRTLFDADSQADSERIAAALTEVMKLTEAVAKSAFMWLPDWVPTSANRHTKSAVKALDEIIMRIVNERRASGEDRGDLLSMLLLFEDEDGNHMSNQEVRDEAVTLFLAGYETTATALTYLWVLLSEHPQVVEKLHQELEHVLGGRAATFEDLRSLTYTQMIVKEMLRLYPSGPTIGRQNLEPVSLGGYHVPKGTIILIPIHAIQRDPRWWNDPDSFIPERFSKDNEKSIPKYAYFPFGGGQRVCLGNMFAEMELILVLATMAQHIDLRLEPNQSTEPIYLLALRPKEPVHMKTQTREMVVVATE